MYVHEHTERVELRNATANDFVCSSLAGKKAQHKKITNCKKSEFKSYYYELMYFCLVHPTLHISFLILHRFALYRKMRRFFTSENTTKSRKFSSSFALYLLYLFFIFEFKEIIACEPFFWKQQQQQQISKAFYVLNKKASNVQ
mgnify:CR=1 FL=1